MGVGVEGTVLFTTHEYSLLMRWIGDATPHRSIYNLRLCAMEEEKAQPKKLRLELIRLLARKPPKNIRQIIECGLWELAGAIWSDEMEDIDRG